MYRTQSSDTSIEAERYQVNRIRQMSVARRGQMMFDMIDTTRRMSWRSLRKVHPDLSEIELKQLWIQVNYGIQRHGTK